MKTLISVLAILILGTACNFSPSKLKPVTAIYSAIEDLICIWKGLIYIGPNKE